MRARTPLVLLPGLLCTARLWQAQTDALADMADLHVPDLARDDSIVAMAERVLAEAPPTFALGALSMGGYVAFEILRRAPQRVSRLALVATSAEPDSPQRAQQRRRGLAAIGRGRFVGVTRQLLPSLVHPSQLDGPIGAIVQAMAQDIGAEGYRRQQTAIVERAPLAGVLETIRQPTMILVGADDRLTPPAHAEAMRARIPGATLHQLETCGHLPPLEQPEAVSARMRDWLGDH